MACRLNSSRRSTLAGAERGSRVSQGCPNIHCGRVRASEQASRDPFRVLERRHGLAEIVGRGCVVEVERLRVNFPHLEREYMPVSENASRYGYCFAQQ